MGSVKGEEEPTKKKKKYTIQIRSTAQFHCFDIATDIHASTS